MLTFNMLCVSNLHDPSTRQVTQLPCKGITKAFPAALQGIGGTTPARVAGRKLRQQGLLPALLDPMPTPPPPRAASPDPLSGPPIRTPGERTALDSVAAPSAAQLPQQLQPAPGLQSAADPAAQLLCTLRPATAEPPSTTAPSMPNPPAAASAFYMPAVGAHAMQPGLYAHAPLAAGPTSDPAQLQHSPDCAPARTGMSQQSPSAGGTGTAAACWDLVTQVPDSQQLLPGAGLTSSAPQQPRSSQHAPASWHDPLRQDCEARGMAPAFQMQHSLPPSTPLQLSSHLVDHASSQHRGHTALPMQSPFEQPEPRTGSIVPDAVTVARPAEQVIGAGQAVDEDQCQDHWAAAGVAGALGMAGFPPAVAGLQASASAGPSSAQPAAAAAEHADAAGAAQDDPDYDPDGCECLAGSVWRLQLHCRLGVQSCTADALRRS